MESWKMWWGLSVHSLVIIFSAMSSYIFFKTYKIYKERTVHGVLLENLLTILIL